MAYDLLGGYDLNKTEMHQLTPEEREEVRERWTEYWQILSASPEPTSRRFATWWAKIIRRGFP